VLASTALREMDGADGASATRVKKDINLAIEAVAGVLGNTKAVCRKSYIHPAIIDSYVAGRLARRPRPKANQANGLRSDEAAALVLLKRKAA
jgi:DNA topoisomerase-1